MTPTRRQRLLIGVKATLTATVVLSCAFAAAHVLMSWVYRAAGLSLSPLVAQVGSSLAAMLLLSLAIRCALWLMAPRAHEQRMGWLGPIIEAMQRIAKGDFSVRLDDSFQGSGPVGTLVQSMNTMAAELDQMEQLRQQFISDVSHEIQSPLTSIRGFAQALQNDGLSVEERHHYLGIIESESMRLSRTAADLLSLAALDSERLRFEPAPYRLDRQLRDVVLACEPMWRGKGIEVDATLDEVTITADEDLLSQVWTNLVHNSVKFTPAGGRVSVALHRQDGRVLVGVADTGIGIAAEDQGRIFERFYKVDRSRTHSGGGSGLGLAIAARIVEIHRGTISVHSEPGAGAAFTVSLPDAL